MFKNIGGPKNDSSYRYKRPVLQNSILGSGNGIKTIISNINEVSKALHVEKIWLMKYFGFELGTQVKQNTLNGNHPQKELEKILEKFIRTFVLCPKCNLPELQYRIKSSIKIDCAACGNVAKLKTGHKIEQYLIKHNKTKEDKVRDDEEMVEDDTEIIWYTDSSEEAQKRRREEEFGIQ